jgi:four helix bundle protein
MVSKPQGLQVSHASAILTVSSKLPKTPQANHVSRQLLRSGTAAAANYGEARGAESRPDFIHKLRIVLKELNETSVWLGLIVENAMLPTDKMRSNCRGKRRIVKDHRRLCPDSLEALQETKARLRLQRVAISSD